MWRFYAIATAIVVAIGSVVFARHLTQRPQPAPSARGPAGTASPAGLRGGVEGPHPAQTFRADAPWVMSALPGCFDQQRSIVGPARVLGRRIPPASARLRPGTRRRWSDCTIDVGTHDVVIARGRDRVRVPPDAALYEVGDRLTLVWRSPYGRTEIRVYTRPPAPTSP